MDFKLWLVECDRQPALAAPMRTRTRRFLPMSRRHSRPVARRPLRRPQLRRRHGRPTLSATTGNCGNVRLWQGSQAVKRPSDAVPLGEPGHAAHLETMQSQLAAGALLSRLAGIERQADSALSSHVALLHHLRTVEDRRHEELRAGFGAQTDRVDELLRRVATLEQDRQLPPAPDSTDGLLKYRLETLETFTCQTADRLKQVGVVASANLAAIRRDSERIEALAVQLDVMQRFYDEVEQVSRTGDRIVSALDDRRPGNSSLPMRRGGRPLRVWSPRSPTSHRTTSC